MKYKILIVDDDKKLLKIHELIINAMVHRSYLDHGTIQVAVYDNRLEITRLDNGSRFLSCLVYPESGYFTGFPGHQSFCLVL